MVKRFEFEDGTIVFRNENGFCHREDGPAFILPDGTKSWYNNGKYHREDGPAVIFPDGREYWFKYGKAHREDGPAVIFSDGREYWWLNGESYSFKEWVQLLNISDEEKMELVLRYG